MLKLVSSKAQISRDPFQWQFCELISFFTDLPTLFFFGPLQETIYFYRPNKSIFQKEFEGEMIIWND